MHRKAVVSANPSLTKKIQAVRNLSEHRKRVSKTRALSATSLNKCMSFDKNKMALYKHIRSRKQYTGDYERKEREQQKAVKDMKMLDKMWNYKKKEFVFSRSAATSTDNLLHHNAATSLLRQSQKIEVQNQQINFRITKAKSQYSQKLLTKDSRASFKRYLSIKKVGPDQQNRHPNTLKTQTHAQQGRKQHSDSYKNALIENRCKNRLSDSPKQLKIEVATLNLFEPFASVTSQISTRDKIQINVRKHLCSRIQSEKLAQKLYLKKQNRQNLVPSKLTVKK